MTPLNAGSAWLTRGALALCLALATSILGFGPCASKERSGTALAREPRLVHADTVFAEDFESGTLAAWRDGVDPTRQRGVTDPTSAQAGSQYLAVDYPA